MAVSFVPPKTAFFLKFFRLLETVRNGGGMGLKNIIVCVSGLY